MQIIGISGKAESGKTTTALLLQEELNKRGISTCFINYGDLVKYVAKQYYNWQGEKDQKGRTLLQYIGTDLGREKVDNSIWVNMIINIIKILQYNYNVAIIGDCRFPNEYEEWNKYKKDFNMIKLRIERPNYKNKLTKKQKQHLSETALDNYCFDYTIINNDDLNKLKNEVNKFINSQLKLDFK